MPVNVGAGVYGVIAVGALLAAETAARETYADTIEAIALAMVLYWLAHSYAESVSRRADGEERLTPAGVARTMVHELPMMFGAAIPLLAVVIAWIANASLASALSAGVWTAAGTVVIVEVLAGIRAKLSTGELLVQGLVGSLLGLLVLSLRLVLH